MSLLPFFRPPALRLLVTLLVLVPLGARAAAPAHDLYVCVSMTGAFFIGSQVQRLNGVYRSTDRQEITHLGFNHPRLDALAADPRDSQRLYVAGLNGAMGSIDGGQSWRILTSWDMTEGKGVAVDPHQPDRLFLALPDGVGVSEDRGQTWHRRQEGIRRPYTQTVVVDRAVRDQILIGTELGIYRSTDAGRSWSSVLTTSATVTHLQQSPHDPAQYLASTQREGAWVSRDHGRTWSPLTGVPRGHTLHNVAFDGKNARRLALSGWGVGVRVSEDGGATWSDRSAGLPNANVWRVAIDPDFDGRLYASPHESPIYVSDDFGRTWRPHWFEGATVWGVTFVPRR